MKWQTPASRRSRISLPRVPPSHSDTMTEGNQSQYRRMPPKEDLVRAFYRMASQSHMPARASQTLRPGTQTLKESSLPLYSLVNGSTPTCWEGHLQWSPDHKPLEMIHQKSLLPVPPPQLLRMLLQLQRYDVTIRYRPGKEMLLADALSRCPSRASGEIKLDMRVDYNCLQQDLDSQTQGYHQGRPHSWHGLPAHSSRSGHIKGGILREWPGRTGTSETSSPQMRGLLLMGPRNCHSILPS